MDTPTLWHVGTVSGIDKFVSSFAFPGPVDAWVGDRKESLNYRHKVSPDTCEFCRKGVDRG